MSGPRRRHRRPRPGVSRRQFLARSSAGLAALGLAPLLPGCGGGADGGRSVSANPSPNPPPTSAEPVFRHGVASGDPLSDRVILWTRVTSAQTASLPVTVRLSTRPDLGDTVLEQQGQAMPARDYTVKLDVAGLAPATTYYYQFEALGQRSPIGRTRTLPVGAVPRMRIGVLSCSSYAHGFFNAYARVAERADLDLVLHLGDYVYEYGNGGYGSLRTYEPAHEMVTLEDYRTRHAYYKLDPDLQALHRQHPTVCVWDDHESTNDSWKDGAENHQPELEGEWGLRKRIAQRVYEEWMPIRVADPSRIYRRFALGDLADLLMLDTRLLGRSQPLPASLTAPGLPAGVFAATGEFADPARSLLGEEQEQWLAAQLRDSGATWKLLGQQVMFGQLQVLGAPRASGQSLFLNPDQWDGYPLARERVFALLEGDATHPPVDNAVVLTGDIHTAWAMNLSADPNNPLAYDPLTGAGSRAVEFVATSVTSPGLESLAAVQDLIRVNNPHIQYVDLERRGYLLLDITPQRCLGEFWAVDSITARDAGQSFQAAYEALAGSNRLRAADRSDPPSNPPALAG